MLVVFVRKWFSCDRTDFRAIAQIFVRSHRFLCDRTDFRAIAQIFVRSHRFSCDRTEIMCEFRNNFVRFFRLTKNYVRIFLKLVRILSKTVRRYIFFVRIFLKTVRRFWLPKVLTVRIYENWMPEIRSVLHYAMFHLIVYNVMFSTLPVFSFAAFSASSVSFTRRVWVNDDAMRACSEQSA